MEATTEKIYEEIEEILEKNRDAQKGFAKAADNAKNSSLRSYFQRKSANRASFNTDLAREIKTAYPDFDVDGTFSGNIHRVWMDVKSFFSIDNDESMLEEAIRGDKAAVEEYDDVLDYDDLPVGLRSLLLSQRAEIQKDLEESKILEEQF